MSIWNYLSQNGDPKRTLGSLPQKSVNWNYTVPADNTYVYRPAPIAKKTIADYASLPKYWDAQGRIHTAYTGKTATREDIGRNLKIIS